MELSENFCQYRVHSGGRYQCYTYSVGVSNCDFGLRDVKITLGRKPYISECEHFRVNPFFRGRLIDYLVKKAEKKRKKRKEYRRRRSGDFD